MLQDPVASSLIFNAPEAGLFLDAGCGECDFANILRNGSRKIICMDVKKPQNPLKNDDMFIQCSVESLPFKDNSYDFSYCLGVIQLVQDDRAAIEEVYRVLKPGGRFYLTLPTRISAFRIIRDLEIRFGTYRYPQFNVKHHHYYAKKDIEILIQDLFQIESVSGYGYNFIPRLLIFLLDLFKMSENVLVHYHSIFIPKADNEFSSIWKNRTVERYGDKPRAKNKIPERIQSLFWLIYGLAYHYIIVLKKG
jgi:SAM-dependent methyltransferase